MQFQGLFSYTFCIIDSVSCEKYEKWELKMSFGLKNILIARLLYKIPTSSLWNLSKKTSTETTVRIKRVGICVNVAMI